MKYQKTVKCKLFITKSGMWVEIGEKNSKSEILFCFKFSQIRWFYGSVIAGVLTYVTITTFWLVSSFFSLEVEKLFQHNILKLIEIISSRVARYGVTFTYPLAKVLHFLCAVSPITLF